MRTNLRPELAERLHQCLESLGEGFRHNVALLGPAGSGKTYQLQRLLAHQPPNLLAIYCPLFRESCRSFLSRLACAILQAGLAESAATPRAAFRPTDHDTEGRSGVPQPSLHTVLLAAEQRLPKTSAAMRVIENLLARRLYSEAFNRTLDAIPVLMEERQRPAVVILDEFLFLEELGLVHAFHELGKRVMTWQSTLFILSSSSLYRARNILRERLQLLFGQFELLMCDTMDSALAAAWAKHALTGVRSAHAAIPFLTRWLGGYPGYLSVFLRRMKELTVLSKSARSTEALVLQTAWDVLGSPEGPLHHWCVSRLEGIARVRLGTRATEALLHIAEGARTATAIGARMGRSGLSDALQFLAERDLAQRNGMCWTIPDPILRCWLSTVFSTQRAEPRPEHAGHRERLDQHLRTLWTAWMQLEHLSLPEQVAGLFTKFCDETVSLDSKVGRLPKFATVTTRPPDAAGGGTYLIAEGQGKRWCAAIPEGLVDENGIAKFDAFCRAQAPKPSRKVVIMSSGIDPNARLLAKTANMWVWEASDLHALMSLYGQL